MEDTTGNHPFYDNVSFSQNTTNYPTTLDNTNLYKVQLKDIMSLALISIGLVLNSLIITVITCGSLMKTSVFMILLLILAIADNTTLFFLILRNNEIYYFLPFSQSSNVCGVLRFFRYTSAAMSSWIVVLISAERFIAVFYPFKVHIYCTRGKTAIATVGIFVMLVIIHLPIIFGSTTFMKGNRHICGRIKSVSLLETLFTLFVVLVYSVIPFCLIAVSNIQIVRKIIQQRQFTAQHQKNKSSDKSNVLFMLLAVSLIFIVTTLPQGICHILTSLSRYTTSIFMPTCNLDVNLAKKIWIVNHCVNFLLYCLTGSVFRQTLVHLLRCSKRHESSRSVQSQCRTVQETVL